MRGLHRHFNQGDLLFRQGDPSDYALRIDSGSVEILRGTLEAEQFNVPEFFQRVSADPAMAQELMLRLWSCPCLTGQSAIAVGLG